VAERSGDTAFLSSPQQATPAHPPMHPRAASEPLSHPMLVTVKLGALMTISKHSACFRQIRGASWHNWLYSGVHPVVSTGCRCGGGV